MKRRMPILSAALLALALFAAAPAAADEIAMNGLTANTIVTATGTAEQQYIYFHVSGRTGVATGVVTVRWRAATSGAGAIYKKLGSITNPSNTDDPAAGHLRIPAGIRHLQIELSGYSGSVPVDVVVVGWRGTFS